MTRFEAVAELVGKRNSLAEEFARTAGAALQADRLGEVLASLVFGIRVAPPAERRGFYGHFIHPPLRGCSVSVRWYVRPEGRLELRPDALPDYCLVFEGPAEHARSLPRSAWPWTVQYAYLFDVSRLMATLDDRGIARRRSISVRRDLWQAAEIFPAVRPDYLLLTPEQRELLRQLAPGGARTQ